MSSKKNYEYKSVRIVSSTGCMVIQNLIDIALNKEGQNDWELVSVFPHSCSNSDGGNCIIAIFKREVRD